jgi:hypothetical protein
MALQSIKNTLYVSFIVTNTLEILVSKRGARPPTPSVDTHSTSPAASSPTTAPSLPASASFRYLAVPTHAKSSPWWNTPKRTPTNTTVAPWKSSQLSQLYWVTDIIDQKPQRKDINCHSHESWYFPWTAQKSPPIVIPFDFHLVVRFVWRLCWVTMRLRISVQRCK